jgi:hypothetical protein
VTRYGLGTTARRHFRLVRRGLVDHDLEAAPAICVSTRQGMEGHGSVKVVSAADARAGESHGHLLAEIDIGERFCHTLTRWASAEELVVSSTSSAS